MQEAKEEVQEQEGSEEVQEDLQEMLDGRYDENNAIIPQSGAYRNSVQSKLEF